MSENLANNLSFVLGVIIDDVHEPCAETLEAALILARVSWNNAIRENHSKLSSCATQLGKLQERNPGFWKQLIRNDAVTLIDVLMKRKEVFYADDNRFVKGCYINALGTITVIEDNDEETHHVESRL